MFNSCALPRWRLIFPAMLLVTLLAACDNPPAASTPAANTPGASTPGQPQAAITVRPASSLPTNTPNLSTAEGRINSGNTHFQNNECNEAIADYTEAIKMQPDLAAAYSDRASAYIEVKEYDKAIQDANQAVKLKPELPWAYAARASAYRNKGDLDHALADYEQLIKLQPDYAKAYLRRGEILEQRGDKQSAKADYQKAFDLSTKDINVRKAAQDKLDALEGK
jgi:tetratricopeptide (TPR) repeat protein